MGSRVFLCSALLLLLSTANTQQQNDYRLSNRLDVISYTVNLTFSKEALTGSTSAFQGKSEVRFQLVESSNVITIHSKVNITSHNLSLSNGTELVTLTSENLSTEIVTLRLNDSISDFQIGTYNLIIVYEGTIEAKDMHGLYRSEYKDENNLSQYLLATQFESTYARRVFPCFDEPSLKANFSININYPTGYNVLANTAPVVLNEIATNGTETVNFVTPKMSTYLLAFIISNFSCSPSESTERVCSRPESLADRSLALNTSRKIIAALDDITNISYSQMGLKKIEHVAIPDFSAGAMENWGLITYREARLLWNKNESSVLDALSLVTVVAHELTHMWFGNLVTLDWWDYTFLNEGFARFYQYFAAAKVEDFKSWELDKLFIPQVLQYALDYDAKQSSSAPLTKASFNETEIRDKFDSISYDKGACLLRMLQNAIGEDKFTSGIRSYLDTHKFSSVKPIDLWSSLENFAPTLLPNNVSLEKAMTNWTDKRGYPVLYATLNGSTLTVSQDHFTYAEPKDDTQWYVPISYILPNQSSDNTSYVWLEPGTNLSLSNLADTEWIILNNKATGYYRVNYDANLWEKINQVLHSNTTQIDVLNRAQIVDDVLSLARARKVNYTTALKIVHYIKRETEFYPWHSALTAFDYLFKIFEESSEIGKKLREYLTDLTIDIHDSSLALNTTDQSVLIRRVTILEKLNRLSLNHSTDSYLRDFKYFAENGTSVNQNIRSVVYCKALRHDADSNKNWNILWEKLTATKVASEQNIIIRALGCTANKTTLLNYLNTTIFNSTAIRRQDVLTAWSGVISNPVGIELALDFFIDNYLTIQSLKINTASLVKALGFGLTTEDKLTRFFKIAGQAGVDPDVAAAVRSTVTAANTTLQWKSAVRADFESYFNITAPNATVPSISSGNETVPAGLVPANPPVGNVTVPTEAISNSTAEKPADSSGLATHPSLWVLSLLGIISMYAVNV